MMGDAVAAVRLRSKHQRVLVTGHHQAFQHGFEGIQFLGHGAKGLRERAKAVRILDPGRVATAVD